MRRFLDSQASPASDTANIGGSIKPRFAPTTCGAPLGTCTMQNTHGNLRLIGRAALVALLVAPSLGAQDRWEDRDRYPSGNTSTRDRNDDVRWDNVRARDAERRLFTWRGSVDDDTRIYIRAANIESRVVSGRDPRSRSRVDRDRSLPRRDGTVRVQLLDGRGRIQVLQQPSARNGYTAIIRVKDGQAGADSYRFAAFFDPMDDSRRADRDGRVWDDVGGDVWSGARVFRWSGSVDGDLRISLRGGSVGYSVVSGEQPRGVNVGAVSSLPRRDGQLAVSQRQGRGSITVIQQPSSWNDYTAIVRVIDSAGGYGYYDFDLFWR
jgi:hypothetical protein